MDVRGIGGVSGPAPVRLPTGTAAPAVKPTATGPQIPKDELQLSSAGKLLDQLSQSPDIRQERLARIKAAIADGTYDTQEKLEAALGKMLQSLGLDEDA